MTRTLFYSDDIRCAYLSEIVRKHEAVHSNGYLGRTAIQKLAYFCKVLGVPIPCRFDIYTYGPYTEEITFAVESMLADGVLRDESQNVKYSNYRLGPAANELLLKYRSEIAPYDSEIVAVVRALGSGGPRDLELISTLHFVADRFRRTHGFVSKERTIDEFTKIKKAKFSRDEIETWYDKLSAAGLIASSSH